MSKRKTYESPTMYFRWVKRRGPETKVLQQWWFVKNLATGFEHHEWRDVPVENAE